jgi:osmotically-inducible protein OsmY
MRKLALLLLLVSCFSMTGCAGLMVAGAGAGAVASQDRRTVPTQLEDQNIEIKTIAALFENDEIWADTNIEAVSYNATVLLVGQAPTASLKQQAKKEVESIANVKKVYNQIRIAAPISFFARRNDEFVTSKVKSSMIFTENFPSGKVKVVTENNEVFLLGLVTKAEADKAVEIARNVDGVSRVIKVFEIIEDENE